VTDRAAAYSFSLLLVCFTVYLCFRGIAFVVKYGWRSMLGLVAVRAEAVVEWQDCDRQPCGCPVGGVDYSCKTCRARMYGDEQGRNAWDNHVDSALDVLMTHEAGVADGATPQRWIALEEEFADLDGLAAQLGERAS
jgi:hypothetical protein